MRRHRTDDDGRGHTKRPKEPPVRSQRRRCKHLQHRFRSGAPSGKTYVTRCDPGDGKGLIHEFRGSLAASATVVHSASTIGPAQPTSSGPDPAGRRRRGTPSASISSGRPSGRCASGRRRSARPRSTRPPRPRRSVRAGRRTERRARRARTAPRRAARRSPRRRAASRRRRAGRPAPNGQPSTCAHRPARPDRRGCRGACRRPRDGTSRARPADASSRWLNRPVGSVSSSSECRTRRPVGDDLAPASSAAALRDRSR